MANPPVISAASRTRPPLGGRQPLAVVHVANTCNLHCVFCLEQGDRDRRTQPELADIRKTLAGLRANGATDVVFMGAETLLRRDAVDVLGAARDAGFRGILVATNGTALSRTGYLDRLVAAGLNALELSIHGATADVADRIAGTPGTFSRQASALAAMAKVTAPLDLTVNIVICQENAASLAGIASYVRQHVGMGRQVHFKFIFAHLLGGAWLHAREDGPHRYGNIDFIALGDRLVADGVHFHIDNVPLCRLGAHAAHSLKLRAFAGNELFYDRELSTNTYHASGFQTEGQIWPASPCGACTLRPICPGVEEQYARLAGTAELRASTLPPVDVLRQALALNDGNPLEAEVRIAALRGEPRPDRVLPRLAPDVVRLSHPALAEPLDVRVEAHAPEKPSFAHTGRFAMAYRPWAKGDAAADPRVREVLRAALAALTAADAAGDTVDEARARVAAAAAGGWTAQARAGA